MKTLILIPLSILGLILFVTAQNEKPPTEPTTVAVSPDQRVLCSQLGLVEGGDYVIDVGTPSGTKPPCYTVLALGNHGWIKVEINREKNEIPFASKGPHWLNLAQVATIQKVDRSKDAAAPNRQ